MSVIKDMVSRAWVLQHRIENRFRGLPSLGFGTYLFFVGMVFVISGFLLYVFCFVTYVDPWLCQPLSCPFFYLVMGFICFFVWLGYKRFVERGVLV